MISLNNLILVLRITCFFLFAGRAWQHLFWDAPFRELLWDEKLMTGLVETLLGMTWYEYATHPMADIIIQKVIKGFGWFYAACAIATLFVKRDNKIAGAFLLAGSLALIFLAFLYFKDRHYQLAMFTEYAAQFGAPLFLYFLIYKEVNIKVYNLLLKAAIALTFTSHGLYALGWPYPRPGEFVDMIILSLGVTESTAHIILDIAAYLDFLISIMIFIPRIAVPALCYAIIWGFLTAMARIVANYYADFAFATIHEWLPHVLYRISHAGLPLIALLIEQKTKLQRKLVYVTG